MFAVGREIGRDFYFESRPTHRGCLLDAQTEFSGAFSDPRTRLKLKVGILN
jgi:hypothetical protein